MRTRMELVWTAIRDHGPITCAGLAERLNLTAIQVSHAIADLRKHHLLTHEGRARACHWSVPAAAEYMHIGRGGHPNSRRNLRRDNWHAGLAAIRAKGRPSSPDWSANALEACWRSIPTKTGA